MDMCMLCGEILKEDDTEHQSKRSRAHLTAWWQRWDRSVRSGNLTKAKKEKARAAMKQIERLLTELDAQEIVVT